MHDIRWIRENQAAFDAGLVHRNAAPLAQALLEIDDRRRAAIQTAQASQERRNALSKEIGQAMAADRTLAELEYQLSSAYASQLVRPMVEVTLKTAGPVKVWVAGEVRTPGVYDMNGDMDAYQAIVHETADHKEAVTAFLEKRPPHFTGD